MASAKDVWRHLLLQKERVTDLSHFYGICAPKFLDMVGT